MVSDPFLVGVFFGLVPGFGFLYILLHRYERLFSERRAFFAFFVGFGLGLVATLLQLFIAPTVNQRREYVALYPLLFGLINVLLLTMVLNSRRYRRQGETPFLGVAMGLGFGSLNVLFLIGNAVGRLAPSDDVIVSTLGLTLLGLYFIGSILVHGATGAWIGRGTATGTLTADFVRAAIAESLYLVGFFLLFLNVGSQLVPPIGLLGGILLIAYILREVLDPIIPSAVRREMGIHQRRLARQLMRRPGRSNETDPDEARTPGSPDEAPPPPERPSS